MALGRPKFTLEGVEGAQYVQLIKNIENYIKYNFITKQSVAEKMDTSPSQLGRYLKSSLLEKKLKGTLKDSDDKTVMLSMLYFLKLCRALQVTPMEIMTYHIKDQDEIIGIQEKLNYLQNKLDYLRSKNNVTD